MNKLGEDYKKYMESINPIMQYERLKTAQEKDKHFIEKLQHAFNQWIVLNGSARDSCKVSNGGNGDKV